MPEPDARVAVYIDFDNIVISRYDQTFRRGEWQRDGARHHAMDDAADPVGRKLAEARVDVGALLDYASSFGSVVVSRAYADWSLPANAAYRGQLVDRAVDLTQLFPVTAGVKNGADIRLSVDVVEDLFRLPDLTHVVVVAGDSDYIALAQRARRLGRYVVGIGVAGSTSRALMAACDEYADYGELVDVPELADEADDADDGDDADDTAAPGGGEAPASGTPGPEAGAGPDAGAPDGRSAARPTAGKAAQRAASQLLVRAMRLIHDRKPDDVWLSFGEVKNQMLRMDPAFSEKPLGFGSFSDFVASRGGLVETSPKRGTTQPEIRLRAR
ncbi:NYN domain-containing protein [Cellulomonas alba]|uniref:NYN domain-containing protein n=1 Tax=Cellulomonas alba TaxID=3053467 RepID=A0ABT7SIH6_9CELL|nr:NYN domain-containing protein [Cellulomonas alba]MDM7855981.1 NYN domain-containing protein [Cellulomonas alba]